MAEPFKATTHFGDLTGHVAFDGHNGPPLDDFVSRAKVPAGYFPVGLHFSRLALDDEGMIRFQVMAVDIEQAGDSWEKIAAFAKSSDEVPIYPFPGTIKPDDFFALFKRFDLTVIHKALRHANANANIIAYSAP